MLVCRWGLRVCLGHSRPDAPPLTHAPDPTATHPMNDYTPTVEDVLGQTAASNGFHDFAVEGGTIRVTTAVLRQVLENYYDPCMTNWVALIDESDFEDVAIRRHYDLDALRDAHEAFNQAFYAHPREWKAGAKSTSPILRLQNDF